MTGTHDTHDDSVAHTAADAAADSNAFEATPSTAAVAPCGLYAIIALACVTLVAVVVLCQVGRALNQFEPSTIDNALTRFAAIIVLVIFVVQSLLVDALMRDACCDHNHWRRDAWLRDG